MKEQILTNNDSYVNSKILRPSGIMVHSTGCNYKYVKAIAGPPGSGWNQPGIRKSVHAVIGLDDNDKITTVQTMPTDIQAWHCGGSGNATHLSFEMFEDDRSDPEWLKVVWDYAVMLCVDWCVRYEISPQNIIGHYEGYQQGIASNHADPGHWFRLHDRSMDEFRDEVGRHLDNYPHIWSLDAVKWCRDNKIMLGDDAGNLHLRDYLTREEMCCMLYRAAHCISSTS